MNKIMNALLRILLWIWQLPQNLLAVIIIRWVYTEYNSYCFLRTLGRVYFYPTIVRNCFMDNFTLGDYVFISSDTWLDRDFKIRKSYGHVRLSRIFGPLWLLAIAIPRYVYAYYDPMGFHLEGFYTETLANKLSKKKGR